MVMSIAMDPNFHNNLQAITWLVNILFWSCNPWKSIIREIERVKTNKDDVPESNVVIDQCGVWTDDMPVPIFNASYDTIGGYI